MGNKQTELHGNSGWSCAAALYVDGEMAWLGIGATKPDVRRRGGQSALLHKHSQGGF
jgi:hypothetical protein